MNFTIEKELNPIYETMFLLFQGYDLEKFKNALIAQVNDATGNGEEFFQKQFKLMDKYFSAFQKNRIESDRDSFYFKDSSLDFFCSFALPFLNDMDLINSIYEMDNDQVFKLILKSDAEIFEKDFSELSGVTHTEFITADMLTSFINQFDINENEKWKMFLILVNPKDYYGYFADMIKKNLSAFEKAVESIKTPLEKYFGEFTKAFSVKDKAVKFLEDYSLIKFGIQKITPTFSGACSLSIFNDTCYYGLLFDKTIQEFGYKNNSKDYLINCFKALSDHSKFEILVSLKSCPKYATELAAELGLTAATVSYHMGTLIGIQLVYIKKEKGKYYYYINESSLSEILEQLKQLFLS